MSLVGKLTAGRIEELQRLQREGRSAVDSAQAEWLALRQQLMRELEQLNDHIRRQNETIAALKERLKWAQAGLKGAQEALLVAQSKLSSRKPGESPSGSDVSEVAMLVADVRTWQDRCHRLLEELTKKTKDRDEVVKMRNALQEEIRRIDSQGGQNIREARCRWDEARIQKAIEIQRGLEGAYHGGR